jgi:hypothetical protein
MNEADKILNVKESTLGHTIGLADLTPSQISQIKTTARSEKHWLKVSMFVFSDESYIVVEPTKA